MPDIQLWGAKRATCTDRVLFIAAELGLPLTLHPIDLHKGQQKSADYIQRQPFGKIPAVEIDGLSFYESRAIARVLARSSPAGEQLFPSSDIKRVAVFEQWASLEVGTTTPILEKVVMERVFKQWFGKVGDEAVVKRAMEDGQTAFQVLAKQLSSNEYVTGDFSLVDVCLCTYFAEFATTAEGKQTLEQYPNIAAWWQRLSSRPAWQNVVAEREEK